MSAKHDHEFVRHDPSEGFDPTEPAAPQITMFVIISVVTLVVVIGAIQFYFNQVWNESVYEKVLSSPGQQVRDLRNLEAWRMTHYEYATPAKDTVRIPFDRAQELFLADQAAGKTFYKAQATTPVPEEPAKPEAGKDAEKGKGAEKGKEEAPKAK